MKKFLVLLLLIALAASLFGCGNTAPDPDTDLRFTTGISYATVPDAGEGTDSDRSAQTDIRTGTDAQAETEIQTEIDTRTGTDTEHLCTETSTHKKTSEEEWEAYVNDPDRLMDPYVDDHPFYYLVTGITQEGFSATTGRYDYSVVWPNAAAEVIEGRYVSLTYYLKDLKPDGEKRFRIERVETLYLLKEGFDPSRVADKPVIYLYPQTETAVHVRVEPEGVFLKTIPEYPDDGWTVTASPDGTLTAEDGTVYPYLFWEAKMDFDLPGNGDGFCVPGDQTEAFLTRILTEIGLNAAERADFIEYWLPRMAGNRFNRIRFHGADYVAQAPLTVDPKPDSVLRVFMTFSPSEEYTPLRPQTFVSFVRSGFTVVEWGGSEYGGIGN